MTWDWLYQLFKFEGQVVDVYVSHKMRKNTDSCFGFVRFKRKEEAIRALEKLDGTKIRGKNLKVSLAKYDKQGKAWQNMNTQRELKGGKHIVVTKEFKEAYRDNRSYKEVVAKGDRSSADKDVEGKGALK